MVHHSKEHINYKSRKLLESVNCTVSVVVILYFVFRDADGSTNETTAETVEVLPPKTT